MIPDQPLAPAVQPWAPLAESLAQPLEGGVAVRLGRLRVRGRATASPVGMLAAGGATAAILLAAAAVVRAARAR